MAVGAVLGIPHRVLEVWTCGLSRKRLTGLPLNWGGGWRWGWGVKLKGVKLRRRFRSVHYPASDGVTARLGRPDRS